jgi:hypothetical protein
LAFLGLNVPIRAELWQDRVQMDSEFAALVKMKNVKPKTATFSQTTFN